MTTQTANVLQDPAAFRAVFGSSEEPIVLAIVDPSGSEALLGIVRAVAEIRKGGTPLRLAVYGDSSAVLPGAGGIGFLERWTRPLLPSVLACVQAVVPLAGDADSLLEELGREGAPLPRILRDATALREHFGPKTTSPRSRLVLQNEWGLGDELLLSAVAREIVRAYPETEVWIRSRHGFRFPSFVRQDAVPSDSVVVETIYQNPTLYGPASHSPFPGHLVQQMLDKVALDTGLRVKAADVRPELDIRTVRKTPSPSVVLHSRPNPRLKSKDWGLARWEQLARLLGSAGIRLRQVGGAEEPLLPGAEDLRGTAVQDLPEIVAESWAVVSVVGFLMHLAEAARTPAVVIYGGREHPAIDGYPDQVHLSSGPLECRGRWGCHLGPDLECPHGMKCMEGLTEHLVSRAVLSQVFGRDRS